MPAERRMEVKRMVMARGGMGAMAMAGGMHQMMMMDAASMFLAHTGELQLTDAQVTRLAAIARRSEARQKAMHARMDSAMAAMHGKMEAADGGAPGAMMMMMRMPMPTDAERRAQHEDDREAFSVPTPDQLATAWEMMRAHHGGSARRAPASLPHGAWRLGLPRLHRFDEPLRVVGAERS